MTTSVAEQAPAGTLPAARPRVQAALRVGAVDDPLEREADRVAERVLRMPDPAPALAGGRVGEGPTDEVRRCPGGCPPEGCEAHDLLQRRPTGRPGAGAVPAGDAAPLSATTAAAIRTRRGTGQPLTPPVRSFFEQRLGAPLTGIRVHTDPGAAALTRRLAARAFTVGTDVFFGAGEYRPETGAGKRLLAHELVHTLQQGATTAASARTGDRAAAPRVDGPGRSPPAVVQRARLTLGSVTVEVDYGGLNRIADADLVAAITTRFLAFTGAIDSSVIDASLLALTSSQRRWVLYGLDLLQDNTRSPLHDRLDRVAAVQRLIAHSPLATHTFPGALGPPEEEALRAAGWWEVALAAGLAPASAAERARIREILNPPPAGGPGAALDTAAFHARMEPAVRHLLTTVDPANWPSVGTRDLPTLQALGDQLMTEARDFFSPYAHTARTSVFGLSPPFHISASIFSVTALAPNRGTRLGYLRNRATIVGRNTSASPLFIDTNIFTEVNFDGNRPTDRMELENLVVTLEADPAVAAAVDRLIQHTGRQSGSGAGTRIGLSTEFNAASQTACQARWSVIETLCHEILHALTHPDFQAESANVGFGQVLIEGFTEVLATQMFNDRVKPKAAANAAFKARMEAGIAPPPCPAPPDATVGYGAAGAGAEKILARPGVGDDTFRAAFFLGQVHLLGL